MTTDRDARDEGRITGREALRPTSMADATAPPLPDALGAIDFDPESIATVFGPATMPAVHHDARARAAGLRDEAGKGVSSGASESVAPAPPVEPTAFEGPVEFERALRLLLQRAVDASVRRVCWCDPDFVAWPLGDAHWLDLLTRWARLGGRELVMIAGDYRAIERLHPRFVGWRADWSHVIQCLLPDEARTAALPTLWVDASPRVLRVIDAEHWRGRVSVDRIDRQRAHEDFDAVSQRGTPGFSAVTLGL